MTAYQEALRLNPNMAAALYDLGLMYQAMGRNDDAIEAMERWLRLAGARDPGRAEDLRQRIENLQ